MNIYYFVVVNTCITQWNLWEGGHVSVDGYKPCMTLDQCMFFNFNGDAATPVGSKIYKSGSWVNLHPGVMARGDGLHPAAS